VTLTPARRRDLLTRTLAKAIERHQAGDLAAADLQRVIMGVFSALDLLIPRPANVHLN